MRFLKMGQSELGLCGIKQGKGNQFVFLIALLQCFFEKHCVY